MQTTRRAIAFLTASSLLLSSACSNPSSYTGPHLEFSPRQSAERTAFGENEWEWQATCVGFGKTERGPLKVRVRPSWFYCGPVAANGCQTPGEIIINEKHFEAALSHELIHWFEMSQGHAPDPQHLGSVWDRCDHLNNPSSRTQLHGTF